MSEFTPIETQEDLDKVISARLARQKDSLESKYADYDQLKSHAAELEAENGSLKKDTEKAKATVAKYDETISGLNAQVANFQTASLRTKIALKNGLPYELADRLVGDDEKSIQADAERLASFTSKTPSTPLKDPDMGGKTTKGNGAYKSLIEGLNLEGE